MNRLARVFALPCLLLALTPAFASDNDDFDKALIGYSINPVPLDLRRKGLDEKIRIGVGAYLVETMACVGCHTAPAFLDGGNPFMGQPTQHNAAGWLAGGGIFGPFISRNLTPDKNGKPAGLTFDEFKRVLRTGIDLKGLHPSVLPPLPPGAPDLLQVMPWPEYRYSTADTLRALYDYLAAIPCVEGGPGQPAPPAKRCAR